MQRLTVSAATIQTTVAKPALALLTLALVLGGAPCPIPADPGHGDSAHGQSEGHGHTPPGQSEGNGHSPHGHSTLEIPAGQPVPTVTLVVNPDPVRGWNVEIQTTHFRFAPEEVNRANQPGAGHGHLYINGEYYSRIYGPWLHLPSLPSGRHELTVSLNANDHAALTHNGQNIESTAVVEVP
ncbi:hypothetical protein PGN35_004580 [Nodosilinea sp. PGN35]|uniref:hypothetical protein n=1 Tax=Nodosilinea sp. PGN35 TaxID=3020489 RepID=UPI0023B34A5F|nr:hypothetical protein [Nodosilinea sp. TSF1-S3]MDF0365897.1 hypothetical protein [Nodosilinea sp. TSF1-S3]